MAGINEWGDIEFNLYDNMAGYHDALYADQWLQTLYDAALFNHDVSTEDRTVILNHLRDYMWDNYGMDFDNVFDWDGFREAYDNAQL
jgi:hypothetical protein